MEISSSTEKLAASLKFYRESYISIGEWVLDPTVARSPASEKLRCLIGCEWWIFTMLIVYNVLRFQIYNLGETYPSELATIPEDSWTANPSTYFSWWE